MVSKTGPILITGGCGYIGSHVLRQLVDRPQKLLVLDDLSTGSLAALPAATPRLTFIRGDVGDRHLLQEIFKEWNVAAVLHFAAQTIVPDSMTDPARYYAENTMKTLTLADVASRHSVIGFLFSSTAATYGTPRRLPVREDDPAAPESPYGASKLMSERILRDIAAATSMRHVCLRYFNVAGADPEARNGQRTPRATHLIKVAAETAAGKRPGLTIFGDDFPTRDGTCVRDFIHVEDLASAHVQALDYLMDGGRSETMNCGYGRGATVKEVIAAMKAASGRDFPVSIGPRRAGDVAEVVASADRISRILGWRPRFDDLGTIVAHAYRWELKLDSMRH